MLVTVTNECVCCGACEVINPDIFSVDITAKVNCDNIKGNEQDCIDAALVCPVNAIWIDNIF